MKLVKMVTLWFKLDKQNYGHITLYVTHWCLKSIKSGFAIAMAVGLTNLDVLSKRSDTQKLTHGTLQDTKENVWPKSIVTSS